jgi:hypothetical protein
VSVLKLLPGSCWSTIPGPNCYIPVLSAKSDPTPSSMSTGTEPPSSAPYQPFLQRRESQESRQPLSSRRASSSLFPSCTLETWVRAYSPYSPSQDRNRLTSPLSHSHIPFSSSSPSALRVHESDEERGVIMLSSMHPLPMSHSSTLTL